MKSNMTEAFAACNQASCTLPFFQGERRPRQQTVAQPQMPGSDLPSAHATRTTCIYGSPIQTGPDSVSLNIAFKYTLPKGSP
jgi:hypothetical protein